jgi:transposase
VIFVFGNANFQQSVLGWSALERYLVSSLKSLGYLCVFEGESYTSQKCPCCTEQTEYQGVGIRIKYCRKCHIFFHRDTMASQNIAIRAYSIHLGKGIPQQFLDPNQKEPKDDDSKKRKGKNGICFVYN